MHQELLPTFKTLWHKRTGENFEFITSFAGSGTITNQIIDGVPAEIAILSTESDAFRLIENAVLPGPTWKSLPNQGVLNQTPLILMVRRDNPLQIHDFEDLANHSPKIIHPDPVLSGAGQWGILAEYGSKFLATQNARLAQAQLDGIWQNVVVHPASARKAMEQFQNGIGDVLITYEQQYLMEKNTGNMQNDIIYPESSIFCEHIVVRLDKNIKSGQEDLVDGFLEFLWSPEAQRIFIKYGFRSVDEKLNLSTPTFGVIRKPFMAGDLGGWKLAYPRIIQEAWGKKKISQTLNFGK